jgi:hypothetical protein
MVTCPDFSLIFFELPVLPGGHSWTGSAAGSRQDLEAGGWGPQPLCMALDDQWIFCWVKLGDVGWEELMKLPGKI